MKIFRVLKEYPPYSVGDILIHDSSGKYYSKDKAFDKRYAIDYAIIKMYPDFFENIEIKPKVTKPITDKFIELSQYIGELEGIINGLTSNFNTNNCNNIAIIDIKTVKNKILIEDSLWELMEKIEKRLKKTA